MVLRLLNLLGWLLWCGGAEGGRRERGREPHERGSAYCSDGICKETRCPLWMVTIKQRKQVPHIYDMCCSVWLASSDPAPLALSLSLSSTADCSAAVN